MSSLASSSLLYPLNEKNSTVRELLPQRLNTVFTIPACALGLEKMSASNTAGSPASASPSFIHHASQKSCSSPSLSSPGSSRKAGGGVGGGGAMTTATASSSSASSGKIGVNAGLVLLPSGEDSIEELFRQLRNACLSSGGGTPALFSPNGTFGPTASPASSTVSSSRNSFGAVIASPSVPSLGNRSQGKKHFSKGGETSSGGGRGLGEEESGRGRSSALPVIGSLNSPQEGNHSGMTATNGHSRSTNNSSSNHQKWGEKKKSSRKSYPNGSAVSGGRDGGGSKKGMENGKTTVPSDFSLSREKLPHAPPLSTRTTSPTLNPPTIPHLHDTPHHHSSSSAPSALGVGTSSGSHSHSCSFSSVVPDSIIASTSTSPEAERVTYQILFIQWLLFPSTFPAEDERSLLEREGEGKRGPSVASFPSTSFNSKNVSPLPPAPGPNQSMDSGTFSREKNEDSARQTSSRGATHLRGTPAVPTPPSTTTTTSSFSSEGFHHAFPSSMGEFCNMNSTTFANSSKRAWRTILQKPRSIFPLVVAAARSDLLIHDMNVAACLLTLLYNMLRALPVEQQKKVIRLCVKLGLQRVCASVLHVCSHCHHSGSLLRTYDIGFHTSPSAPSPGLTATSNISTSSFSCNSFAGLSPIEDGSKLSPSPGARATTTSPSTSSGSARHHCTGGSSNPSSTTRTATRLKVAARVCEAAALLISLSVLCNPKVSVLTRSSGALVSLSQAVDTFGGVLEHRLTQHHSLLDFCCPSSKSVNTRGEGKGAGRIAGGGVGLHQSLAPHISHGRSIPRQGSSRGIEGKGDNTSSAFGSLHGLAGKGGGGEENDAVRRESEDQPCYHEKRLTLLAIKRFLEKTEWLLQCFLRLMLTLHLLLKSPANVHELCPTGGSTSAASSASSGSPSPMVVTVTTKVFTALSFFLSSVSPKLLRFVSFSDVNYLIPLSPHVEALSPHGHYVASFVMQGIRLCECTFFWSLVLIRRMCGEDACAERAISEVHSQHLLRTLYKLIKHVATMKDDGSTTSDPSSREANSMKKIRTAREKEMVLTASPPSDSGTTLRGEDWRSSPLPTPFRSSSKGGGANGDQRQGMGTPMMSASFSFSSSSSSGAHASSSASPSRPSSTSTTKRTRRSTPGTLNESFSAYPALPVPSSACQHTKLLSKSRHPSPPSPPLPPPPPAAAAASAAGATSPSGLRGLKNPSSIGVASPYSALPYPSRQNGGEAAQASMDHASTSPNSTTTPMNTSSSASFSAPSVPPPLHIYNAPSPLLSSSSSSSSYSTPPSSGPQHFFLCIRHPKIVSVALHTFGIVLNGYDRGRGLRDLNEMGGGSITEVVECVLRIPEKNPMEWLQWYHHMCEIFGICFLPSWKTSFSLPLHPTPPSSCFPTSSIQHSHHISKSHHFSTNKTTSGNTSGRTSNNNRSSEGGSGRLRMHRRLSSSVSTHQVGVRSMPCAAPPSSAPLSPPPPPHPSYPHSLPMLGLSGLLDQTPFYDPELNLRIPLHIFQDVFGIPMEEKGMGSATSLLCGSSSSSSSISLRGDGSSQPRRLLYGKMNTSGRRKGGENVEGKTVAPPAAPPTSSPPRPRGRRRGRRQGGTLEGEAGSSTQQSVCGDDKGKEEEEEVEGEEEEEEEGVTSSSIPLPFPPPPPVFSSSCSSSNSASTFSLPTSSLNGPSALLCRGAGSLLVDSHPTLFFPELSGGVVDPSTRLPPLETTSMPWVFTHAAPPSTWNSLACMKSGDEHFSLNARKGTTSTAKSTTNTSIGNNNSNDGCPSPLFSYGHSSLLSGMPGSNVDAAAAAAFFPLTPPTPEKIVSIIRHQIKRLLYISQECSDFTRRRHCYSVVYERGDVLHPGYVFRPAEDEDENDDREEVGAGVEVGREGREIRRGSARADVIQKEGGKRDKERAGAKREKGRRERELEAGDNHTSPHRNIGGGGAPASCVNGVDEVVSGRERVGERAILSSPTSIFVGPEKKTHDDVDDADHHHLPHHKTRRESISILPSPSFSGPGEKGIIFSGKEPNAEASPLLSSTPTRDGVHRTFRTSALPSTSEKESSMDVAASFPFLPSFQGIAAAADSPLNHHHHHHATSTRAAASTSPSGHLLPSPSPGRNSAHGVSAEPKRTIRPAKTLVFGSNFESGNLQRATFVSPDEYDLVLSFDTTTNSFVQWFFFSVTHYTPGHTYRFNILNMEKSSSTFNEGQRPLLLHVPLTKEEAELERRRKVRALARRGDSSTSSTVVMTAESRDSPASLHYPPATSSSSTFGGTRGHPAEATLPAPSWTRVGEDIYYFPNSFRRPARETARKVFSSTKSFSMTPIWPGNSGGNTVVLLGNGNTSFATRKLSLGLSSSGGGGNSGGGGTAGATTAAGRGKSKRNTVGRSISFQFRRSSTSTSSNGSASMTNHNMITSNNNSTSSNTSTTNNPDLNAMGNDTGGFSGRDRFSISPAAGGTDSLPLPSAEELVYYDTLLKRDSRYYTLTFTVTMPRTGGTVYLANCFPYSYTDLRRMLNLVSASHPHTSTPTPSPPTSSGGTSNAQNRRQESSTSEPQSVDGGGESSRRFPSSPLPGGVDWSASATSISTPVTAGGATGASSSSSSMSYSSPPPPPPPLLSSNSSSPSPSAVGSGAGLPSLSSFMVQQLCLSSGGLPIPLVTATAMFNPVLQIPYTSEEIQRRPVCVMTARVHPGESNSSWMMHGMLDFLAAGARELHDQECAYRNQERGATTGALANSGEPASVAVSLLQSFVFKIVPMINVDGVVMGNHRCSIVGVDLNRDYLHPSGDENPVLYALKGILSYMTGVGRRRVVLSADFHGHSRAKNFLIYGCTRETLINSFKLGKKISTDCFIDGATGQICANVAPEKLFTAVLAQYCTSFDLCHSNFGVQKGKFNTNRVVLYREYGIRMCYGVEASMMGGRGAISSYSAAMAAFMKPDTYYSSSSLTNRTAITPRDNANNLSNSTKREEGGGVGGGSPWFSSPWEWAVEDTTSCTSSNSNSTAKLTERHYNEATFSAFGLAFLWSLHTLWKSERAYCYGQVSLPGCVSMAATSRSTNTEEGGADGGSLVVVGAGGTSAAAARGGRSDDDVYHHLTDATQESLAMKRAWLMLSQAGKGRQPPPGHCILVPSSFSSSLWDALPPNWNTGTGFSTLLMPFLSRYEGGSHSLGHVHASRVGNNMMPGNTGGSGSGSTSSSNVGSGKGSGYGGYGSQEMPLLLVPSFSPSCSLFSVPFPNVHTGPTCPSSAFHSMAGMSGGGGGEPSLLSVATFPSSANATSTSSSTTTMNNPTVHNTAALALWGTMCSLAFSHLLPLSAHHRQQILYALLHDAPLFIRLEECTVEGGGGGGGDEDDFGDDDGLDEDEDGRTGGGKKKGRQRVGQGHGNTGGSLLGSLKTTKKNARRRDGTTASLLEKVDESDSDGESAESGADGEAVRSSPAGRRTDITVEDDEDDGRDESNGMEEDDDDDENADGGMEEDGDANEGR